MIIFPAVDIQDGKAVRLRKGKKAEATVYADDPLELARRWQGEGATWLHIVDLDGAFCGSLANMRKIEAIAALPGIRTQVGGGIRSPEAAARYIEAGASRLIIGTMALEDPALFGETCRSFPGRIGVSLDGSNGRLKTRGWVQDTEKTLSAVLPELTAAGAAFVIYTDIERDGMQTGVNLAALASLLALSTLPVIAAGGVSTLEDIQNLYKLRDAGNLEGAISGRALCEGSLNLACANSWLERQTGRSP